jgi:hypothetical protein
MNKIGVALVAGLFLLPAGIMKLSWLVATVIAAEHGQMGHGHQGVGSMESEQMKGHGHMKHPETPRPKTSLQPAQGASVKILSPKPGQAFKGDEIPVRFKLIKGKKGHHLHAYVDGELMGMFQSEQGTLTGIKPGEHTLEVRVVAEDHTTELDAIDSVNFVVK